MTYLSNNCCDFGATRFPQKQLMFFFKVTMSKENNSAKISDLRNVSQVLKKVRERSSKLKFKRIGSRYDLILVSIGDTSFKLEDKAVGGVFLFLANSFKASRKFSTDRPKEFRKLQAVD